jgi:hypothetical protein
MKTGSTKELKIAFGSLTKLGKKIYIFEAIKRPGYL